MLQTIQQLIAAHNATLLACQIAADNLDGINGDDESFPSLRAALTSADDERETCRQAILPAVRALGEKLSLLKLEGDFQMVLGLLMQQVEDRDLRSQLSSLGMHYAVEYDSGEAILTAYFRERASMAVLQELRSKGNDIDFVDICTRWRQHEYHNTPARRAAVRFLYIVYHLVRIEPNWLEDDLRYALDICIRLKGNRLSDFKPLLNSALECHASSHASLREYLEGRLLPDFDQFITSNGRALQGADADEAYKLYLQRDEEARATIAAITNLVDHQIQCAARARSKAQPLRTSVQVAVEDSPYADYETHAQDSATPLARQFSSGAVGALGSGSLKSRRQAEQLFREVEALAAK